MARFPFQKTLESFDFKFQPSIDPKQIRELATGRYIHNGDNFLLLGSARSREKSFSHCARHQGLRAGRTHAVRHRHRADHHPRQGAGGRQARRAAQILTQPQLLIIDEIGYLPIDRQGANLFFQLVSRRYERGSIIITSNQSLGAWGEVFGDTVIASAILDRLLHHSITINIKGESFRLKEKLKAGLLRPKLEPPSAHEIRSHYMEREGDSSPSHSPTYSTPRGEFQMIDGGIFG